jgi:hypothetical protein
MKKTLLALLVLSSLFSFGQTTQNSKSSPFIQFGLKAGVNVADVKTDLSPNHNSKLDFHAGILGHIHLSPHIALQPEVVYSRQGYEQMIASNRDLEMKLDYINIPILFQYMNRGFRVESGPQVGFLVNAEGDFSTGETDELKDYIKPLDFSWGFGLSYLSPLGIGISGRYNVGISNINDKITESGISNTEMNNRVWQFGLFYQFRR